MGERLASVLGVFLFILVAWAISYNRKKFPWWTVISGLVLQFIFALLILKTPFGKSVFEFAQRAVDQLNLGAEKGAAMVFGPLANRELLGSVLGPQNALVFAVIVSATIIVVSALSSLLYHWGILQQIVRAVGEVMQRVMRTSGSESLSAAANIFMGQTEAPLVIKPYLARMTQSELMAMMVGGMATIAGGVAVAYVSMGANAGHLLTASVMSAPAALLMAKIILPELEQSDTASGCKTEPQSDATNSIDSLCRGASEGLSLALNVFAMLIAFVAVIYLANTLLAWIQGLFGITSPITLEAVFGWINAPFAWLMGVPTKDCLKVGEILGQRIVLNEFIGYLSLTAANEKGQLDPRSFTLATYALCGFANFASIAIQIGGIGALVPARRADLAKLGVKAMVGGLLACYLTASLAGILV